MDEYSQQVVLFLEALAQCNAEFIALCHRLSHHPEVITAQKQIECWSYQTGSTIEGYVDVELQNGMALAWCFDLTWDSDQWTIDAQVRLNDEQGQITIKQFVPLQSKTIEQCIADLTRTLSLLVADAETRDLSNPR